MIYCLNCATENNERKRRCSECSSPLDTSPRDSLSEVIVLSNRYKLIKSLKSGGMGGVYLAKDMRLNTICAIKELQLYMIPPKQKEYRLKSFKNEVEILAKLRHPNLPYVSDYFSEDDKYYIVMDYVDGLDLETIVARDGNPGLDEKRVIQWGITICDVLEYLHSYNPPILYRDLKPANIMLRAKDNQIILIDFGIARMIKDPERFQTAIGTEGYSPPEQYLGKPEPRSDIYSLGVTLYHLLSGEPPLIPFTFSPIREVNPKISQKVESILIKALKKKVEERYTSVTYMKKELTSALKEETRLVQKKEEELGLIGKIKKNILETLSITKETEPQKKIKVFIVEDAEDILLLYQTIIESCKDMELVGIAENGEDAILNFENLVDKPDIILMDIQMPGINGIEATSKIKIIDPSVKVIILSGMVIDREIVLSAFKSGAIGYLVKNNSIENIKEAIRKAYQGGSPIEPEIAMLLIEEFVNKDQTRKEMKPDDVQVFYLKEKELPEILLDLCSMEVTGKLSIQSTIEDGEIYIENGTITHCIYGHLSGLNAFHQSINWLDGKGTFTPKVPLNIKSIDYPTDKLLTELITRRNQFKKIRDVVNSPDNVFELHFSTNSAIVKLNRDELFILSYLDESKSVRNIMKDTGRTYFDVAKAIYDLYNSGLVKLVIV